MQINFFFEDSFLRIPARRKLKMVLNEMARMEKTVFQSLTYIFCSDAYLLDINRQFLQHDDYTDIITFRLSEPREPIEGEIYISADRIKENAGNYTVSQAEEAYRVIFHGALHLCGFKDKSPLSKKKMTAAEDKYLAMMK